jgi:hypothetical protein
MICNGGEQSPPFSFGLLAQLVRALPCHGRGRGFKSHTDRKAPAMLREAKMCYDSHKKYPEIYCGCQWGPVQYSHDKVSEVYLGVHKRL